MVGEGIVLDLGADEVAHQEIDTGLRHDRVAGEGQTLRHRQAEAVHAGIDVERRRADRALGAVRSRPLGHFLARAEHGAQAGLPVGRCAARRKAVQHVDRGLGQGGPCAQALGQVRDEEGAAAFPPQGRAGLGDPAAIGIGLDDGRRLRARGGIGENPPVRPQGREVDGEAAAMADGARIAHAPGLPPARGRSQGARGGPSDRKAGRRSSRLSARPLTVSSRGRPAEPGIHNPDSAGRSGRPAAFSTTRQRSGIPGSRLRRAPG